MSTLVTVCSMNSMLLEASWAIRRGLKDGDGDGWMEFVDGYGFAMLNAAAGNFGLSAPPAVGWSSSPVTEAWVSLLGAVGLSFFSWTPAVGSGVECTDPLYPPPRQRPSPLTIHWTCGQAGPTGTVGGDLQHHGRDFST